MMRTLPKLFNSPLPVTLTTKILRLCVVVLLLVASSSCFDSCQPPFPPSNQIDKFRILAIQVDPPEVTPGDPVKVKFLSVNESGLVKPSEFLDFTKCFVDGGPADPTAIWVGCLPGVGDDPQATNSCGQIPGFGPPASDGGTGGPSDGSFADGGLGDQFQLFFPPCGGSSTWSTPSDYLDPLPSDKQKQGADALVVLATLFRGQQQVTLKKVRLSTKSKSQQNTNPRLTGMKINGKEAEACRPENANECNLVIVPAEKDVEVEAFLDPTRQDSLPPTDGGVAQNEDITIEWFATQGSFTLRRTLRSGANPPEHSPWPKWQPYDFTGKALPQGLEVQIIGIARDKRGGVDWLSLRIILGPSEGK